MKLQIRPKYFLNDAKYNLLGLNGYTKYVYFSH